MKSVQTIFIVLIFISLSFESFSQKSFKGFIEFSGVVLDRDSLTPIPDVHIYLNITKGTTSNENGYFSLRTNQGDTIVFSHVSYKNYQMIVADTLVSGKYITGIFLSKDTVMLSEVLIVPWLTPAKFKQAFLDHQEKDPELQRAEKNLDLMTIQAFANDEGWDPEMSAAFMVKNFAYKATYLGLMSPDELVPITAVVPLIIALAKKEMDKDEYEERLYNMIIEWKNKDER